MIQEAVVEKGESGEESGSWVEATGEREREGEWAMHLLPGSLSLSAPPQCDLARLDAYHSLPHSAALQVSATASTTRRDSNATKMRASDRPVMWHLSTTCQNKPPGTTTGN